MNPDKILQKNVEETLKWEPQLKALQIGVTAKDGIITLTGTVDNYFKKSEAEKAVKKVNGVRAIVEEIEVKPIDLKNISDHHIAEKILGIFKSSFAIPDDKILIEVEKGWVTLEGNVNWNHQKEAARNAVADILGVKGITDNILTKSAHKDVVRKAAVENALKNNAALQEDNIIITVKDGDVTLSGLVKTFFEKEEAERIAWKIPGVWSVVNLIGVDSFN